MKNGKTSKNNALLVAGLIFALVALLHLVRLFAKFNLLVARQLVPVWVSLPAFVISALLSWWMFKARRSTK